MKIFTVCTQTKQSPKTDIGEANKALSAVTDVINFINKRGYKPSYKGEYKGTGFHNELERATDNALRALDAFEKTTN